MAKKKKQPKPAQYKKIRVVLTETGGIFCIPNQEEMPFLLQGQRIKQNFFYDLPHGLDDFLRRYPEDAKLFHKGFAWWIICRLDRMEKERVNDYGKLKRKIHEFNQKLFRAIRSLVCRIAELISDIRQPLSLEEKGARKNQKESNLVLIPVLSKPKPT
ncbi:MAG: hypothetical protein NTX91_02875 [candidate division SR1 bacterium]|nr:hypothetical protein [candidate division SR1 bacterium]